MCGICGLWRRDGQPIDPELLLSMNRRIAHRGPDGAGCIVFDSRHPAQPRQFDDTSAPASDAADADWTYDVGLAHRRLSIIDLSTGDQPMCNEDGSLWVIFNGEIYNYRELRSELQARGHVFHTTSDTEVILHAYEEYGEACPNRFNGIFAFALWDTRRQQLFLARDHFGVKPLYYCLHHDTFYFGSELKAILADPAIPRALDFDALNLCLTFRHTPSPWTLIQSIRKLPPGCSLTVTADDIRQVRFSTDAARVDRYKTEADWIACLRASVEDAVVRQMVSDVPIGISLSSGVDSTTVLALMSKHAGGPVHAFTVGFADSTGTNEIPPARAMAARFGADFYEETITAADYADFMTRYLWHLEEPIGNESAAAYYFVAEMARQRGIKVLLNGQGADEAFGGYGRYFGVAHAPWLRLGAATPVRQVLPRVLAGTTLGEQYRRFVFTCGARSDDEQFLRVYSITTNGTLDSLLTASTQAHMDPDLPLRYVRDQLAQAPEGTPLERMTYVDARTSLPDNLLLCEDKMAMAASVEARVPFLDLELMRLAEQIPGRFKVRGRRDKYIHRKACATWVGEGVTSRPQIGFDNAVQVWLQNQLGAHMQQIVTAPDSFTSAYLNPDYVLRLMQEHAAHHRDHQRILFLLLSLESWYQVFLNEGGAP